MQDKKTRMLISGMSWESQETVALKNVLHNLQGFYQHTELNLDDLGKEDVLGELKALSHKLEDLIGYVITNLDDSVKKDANPIKKICGSCESDKIIYCNDCMIEMEANHGKYDKNNSI
tara:strand:+ start:199 stop:552 length:354 start_codon:yes stop_codon:yes gene_type:complete